MFRKASALNQGNGETLYRTWPNHRSTQLLGELREGRFLLRAKVARCGAAHFHEGRAHPFVRVFHADFLLTLAPFAVARRADALLGDLFFDYGQGRGRARKSALQSCVSSLLLAEPRQNARVQLCASMVFRGSQELGARGGNALLGECAGLCEEAPRLQTPRGFEEVLPLFGTTIDQRDF